MWYGENGKWKKMRFLGKNCAFECLGSLFKMNDLGKKERVEFKLQIHLIELWIFAWINVWILPLSGGI